MRLIIWRHGQTEHNAGRIFQGHLDTQLSALGQKQVRVAGNALAAYKPSVIWSSDLVRAASTARALADVADLPITYDARLREIDVGSWTGLSFDQIKAQDGDTLTATEAGEDVPRGGDGETLAQVGERSVAAVRDLIAELSEDDLAVVATHGVAARTIVAELLDMPQKQAWLALVGLHNSHWAELVLHRTGWRLASWNAGAFDIDEE
ncbi:histidine phosphatase family protein [Ornithinimicrobium sp. Arc0846-15]|nr:histidine phosphatase family protein [Ornithinimicrobium laminariae]